MQNTPYIMSFKQLENYYNVDFKKGLTENEAQSRQKKYGLNKLPEKPSESYFEIFIRQFQNPLIYVLLIAALVNLFFGKILDMVFILVILIINAIIGTIQEGKAQNIFKNLKKLIKSEAVVIRNGEKKIINDEFLVPGDIILIQEGAKIPGDARIIENDQLTVDEAILTGESTPVEKIAENIDQESEIFDQKNMVFRGTYVLFGSAYALVVATGIDSQIGKLNLILEEIEVDLPLKKELDNISHFIVIFSFFITIFLFIISLFFKKSIWEIFFTLTALLVSIIPESLPIIFTISLAYGAYHMAKKQVLVKRLQAVDALGRTQVMVIDKTGTLTRNEMMVNVVYSTDKFYNVTGLGYNSEGTVLYDNQRVEVEKDENIYLMAVAGLLLNRTEIEYNKKEKLYKVKGDPTEAAIYTFAQKTGLSEHAVKTQFKKIYHFQFSTQTRYHAGFFEHEKYIYLFVLGSPEHVLQLCGVNQNMQLFQESLDRLLLEGLRVVACAYKKIEIKKVIQEKLNDQEYLRSLINELIFLGFFGIQDAIREGISEVIKEVKHAKIQIVMATGDHKKTAMYVAKKVGIYEEGDLALSGTEIKDLNHKNVVKSLDRVTVCSRVTPEDKLNLVKLFHKKNRIVAMTGDGVNDVPPLLAADIGIAMGLIGTEITKNAADMILLDDSFFSLVEGIEWGRHIYFTIRRVVFYLFATNLGEVLLITFALLLNIPLPLTVLQILLINFVTDGLLDISLVFEPKEDHLIRRKFPKEPKIIDTISLIRILFIGLIMSISCLFLFNFYYKFYDLSRARTVTWITMAMFQWMNAWNSRSEYKSIFKLNFLNNKWLIFTTILVVSISICVIYIPFFQNVFGTVAISLKDWMLGILLSSSVLIFEELRKYLKLRSKKQN